MELDTQIDPAEAVLSVIGVRPIVSHEIEHVTSLQLGKAHLVGPDIDKQAKALIYNKIKPDNEDFDPIFYYKTLRDLTTPYDKQQVISMIQSIPEFMGELQTKFIALAGQTFQYLYKNFPIQARQALTGPSNTRPPSQQIVKFESLLYVLDDPMRLFGLVASGLISQDQLDGLQAIYPTILKQMKKSLATFVSERKARDGIKFHLAHNTESSIERVLGLDSGHEPAKKLLQLPMPIQANPTPNAKVPAEEGNQSAALQTKSQKISNIGAS